ncbi:MAG: hypothetical protein K9L79_01455 [Methylobacter tundripaludum]|nr:hypothetical protein [Methylobacter tundripaludum]
MTSNSITEAELESVNADLLPPQMRQFVRLIGMAHTLTLLEKRGGVTLRIPVNAHEAVVLKEILPMDAIVKLCEAMPGQRLEMPKIDKIVKQIRNRAMTNERKHYSAASVAQRHNLSRRQVINICKPAVDDGQVDLFDEL